MKRIIISLTFFTFFFLLFPKDLFAATYYVSTSGNDNNPGTVSSPWLTIQKAMNTLVAGDKVYVRKGEYQGVFGGWSFENSGTNAAPITFSNFPGEQVVIKTILNGTDNNYRAFRCWVSANDPDTWQTPKADFVRIIGSDVNPVNLTMSTGIVNSTKGIVVLGTEGSQSIGIASLQGWEKGRGRGEDLHGLWR